MWENNNDIGIRLGKNKLYADFKKRYEEYSKLWWKNKKWMDKTSIEGQVPCFWIRLVSDSAILKLKDKFPEIHQEIQKMSVVFQYIKYRPKKAATEWARDSLARAKYKFNWWKWEQQAKWYHVTARSPTRDSLWLSQAIEQFKQNYPKILYRKSDWTIDYIKSDWTWYLVTMIRHPLADWQVIWQDYFFKYPATIRSTQKAEVDEKVFRKISKVLDELDDIISQFEYGDDEMYKAYKSIIIRLANSLTLEGLNEQLAEKLAKEQEEELQKKLLVAETGWIESVDQSQVNWEDLSSSEVKEEPKKNIEKEVDWDSFGTSVIKEEPEQVKEKKEEEINWDSF